MGKLTPEQVANRQAAAHEAVARNQRRQRRDARNTALILAGVSAAVIGAVGAVATRGALRAEAERVADLGRVRWTDANRWE